MSIIIHNGGEWHARPEVLSEPEEDWDTLVSYPVVAAASLSAALASFAKGAGHPDFANMFVADRSGSALVCGWNRFALEVTYKGLAGMKPVKWQLTSYANRNTYQGVRSPASPLVPATTDVSEPILGLTARYISTTQPDTSLIGTNVVPSLPVDAPINIWDTVADVAVAYPDGWVLEKRDAPNIPGTTCWSVTDYFMFYQPWRPNA